MAVALTTMTLLVQGCGTQPEPRSWPGAYEGISPAAVFVAVKGELLSVTPTGNSVQVAVLADGKARRGSTVTARGEVLGLRVAASDGRLWLGIEACEGKVVHDDLAFCDGTSNVLVFAGAPDDQKLVADMNKETASTTLAARLQAMVAHRDGVALTVSSAMTASAVDVTRFVVTEDAVRQVPGDDSRGEMCSSHGDLYSLVSVPNAEEFKNEGFDLRRLTGDIWKSISLPGGLAERSYNVQLACSDSAVDLVFSQAGQAELYGLDDADHLRSVELANQEPISSHPDWSIDGGAVLSQVAESGAMSAVLIADPIVEVDLDVSITSTQQRTAFVGQAGGSLLIGRITGTTLQVRRG